MKNLHDDHVALNTFSKPNKATRILFAKFACICMSLLFTRVYLRLKTLKITKNKRYYFMLQ